jgi:hypothetical protein
VSAMTTTDEGPNGELAGRAERPGRRWQTQPRLRVLVASAAGVGAVAMPGWHVGIGWFVAAVAVAGVVTVVWRRRAWAGRTGCGRALPAHTGIDEAGPERRADGRWWQIGGAHPDLVNRADRAWRIAAGLAALTLAAVPAVRAAGWLAAVCLLAAVPLASSAVAGGGGWRTLGPSFVALPRAVPAALSWLARPSGRPSDGRWRRLLVAAGAGAVLVLVFGLLFRAADPRFAELVHYWTRDIRPGLAARWGFGFVLFGALAAGAAYLVHNGRPTPDGARPDDAAEPARPLSTVEWGIPLGMLILLFATFVQLQIGTLFGGKDHVMDPSGPDFAEYARTGFVLLVLVTVLTLAVMAALAALADRTLRRDRILLRVLGGALCGLTLVIVASALDRMDLYVAAYGFSGPRIASYAVEAWLGLLFVLVLGAGWRLSGAWLPRAAVGAAVVVLLAVVAVNPDALMARTHANRIDQKYPLDYLFLESLSADAAGELAKLPPELRPCVLAAIAADVERDEPWYRFNLGKHRARAVLVRTGFNEACR